jgi:acyl-coenzyme A thioesterase PaaI-like protein
MAEITQRESTTMGPTISLTINYALAATEACEVTGEIVRIGSSTAIVEGRLRGCTSGEVVATADGVWRVYDSE